MNPNPDISRDAGLVRMAKAHGWSHEDLVRSIVEIACADIPERPSRLERFQAAGTESPAA